MISKNYNILTLKKETVQNTESTSLCLHGTFNWPIL